MGAFFFLAAILLPFNRSFDRAGLAASALLCLLAFYTKPYFMLAFGIVASYLFLFVSKRKALIYGLFFLIVFGICFFWSSSFFRSTSLIPWSAIWHRPTALSRFFYMINSRNWSAEFYPGMIAGLIILWFGMRGWPLSDPLGTVDFRSLDRPVVSRRPNYFAYCFVCSTLAFIFILGTQPGNFMSYAYQLMLPPFFLWLFQELKPQSRLGLILLPVLLFNLASFSFDGAQSQLAKPVGQEPQGLGTPLSTRRAFESDIEFPDLGAGNDATRDDARGFGAHGVLLSAWGRSRKCFAGTRSTTSLRATGSAISIRFAPP